MRNSRILLLFLSNLIGQFSFTQQNFEPGLVINHTGDTIKGFIDYRNWGKNPDKINFKESDSSPVIIFTHADILEFQVHGEIYISAVINSETSPVSTNELEYDPDLNIVVDSTFLQVLVEGSKSLYYYNGESGNKNFYIPNDSLFELLIYKRYISNEQGTISENKKFIGQLVLYLNECQAIQSILATIEYEQKSLMKLFQEYYSCVQSSPVYQEPKEKRKTDIGVLAGVSLTQLDFSGSGYEYLVNTDYNLSTNFSTGLYFDVKLPGNLSKWSINNELLIVVYECEGEYTDYENEDKYSIISTAIGAGFFKISSMLRYKYPVGKFYLYVNGGVSCGFTIMESNNKKTVSKFYSTEKVVRGEALEETRKYELSYLIGLGAKYKRFLLESRYERGNGMSGYMGLKSTTQRFYFLLGYRF